MWAGLAGCVAGSTPGPADPCQRAWISAAGGTLEVAGGTLEVPPGVFEIPAGLAWCHEPTDDMEDSDRWWLEPRDLALSVPLRVEIPHRAERPWLRWQHGDGAPARVLDGQPTDEGRMTGTIWGGGQVWVVDDANLALPFVPDHRELDVLFVVDNSCCTAVEQFGLVEAFPSFLLPLEDASISYQIGVTSTDMDGTYGSNGTQGGLRSVLDTRIITPDTNDADDLFTRMASMGTSGSGSERGHPAIYAAIELRQKTNEGFYRDEANLAVVVVSNEPNQSRGDEIETPEFIPWFQQLKRGADSTLHAVVNQTGAEYVQSAEATGGMTFPILHGVNDFSTYMEAIGTAAADGPVAMTLRSGIVPEALEVWWAPQGGQPVQLLEPDVVVHPSGLLYVTHPEAELSEITVIAPSTE